MSISITRYVQITSGVGAGTTVAQRALVLRMVTQNVLVPAKTVMTFSQLNDVGDYFGVNTDEYKVAEKYFGFVSKTIKTPPFLSIIRWNQGDVAPMLYGDPSHALSLTELTAIVAGNLIFDVEGVLVPISGLNFAAAGNLPGVAAILQTSIQAGAAGNAQLAAATVQYDSVSGRFIITGSVPGVEETISVDVAPTADASGALGFTTGGQISSSGATAQEAVQAISESADADDNFGSFAYVGTVLPTDAEALQIAAWNHAQNNKFMYLYAVTSGNAVAQATAMAGCSGAAITLVPTGEPNDHAETIPAEILAATDYTLPGASTNYMFYQFGNRIPTVNGNTEADLYDGHRINYLGQTQSAGQQIAFYQRGYLQGDSVSAQGMEIYSGEMWLKSAMTAVILGTFLNLNTIPANESGRITLLATIQSVINQGLVNNVISVGKTLTPNQQSFITQVTGNNSAWRQVQDKGYWIDAVIQSYNGPSGVTEYKAVYTLVYGKNDGIRRVTGSDILI